ncbi:MAG: site-specific integrase [Chloroflexi bacterium]|nr:site-specific integrase [Chloroflexota bacterium]
MTEELDYDEQVELIEAENEPILSAFEQWLAAKGLSAKTIRNHVENIAFFAEYLVYYDPLEPLIEADSGDIASFCGNWFPRKAMWASASSARANMASFRKFAAFMVEAKHWDKEQEQEIRETLKEGKEEFIETAESYYDRYDDM